MKDFLGTFVVVLLLLWGVLFFGGRLFFGNSWGPIILCALVVTILVRVLSGLMDQIAALEDRVRTLEEGPENQKEEQP